MKLQFLKQDAVDTLEKNIARNINHYKEKTNTWVYDFFEEDPFLDFKYQVNDFELVIDLESRGRMELENIKILYENMKHISDSQATDKRLWVGLTHGKFYDFVRERWSYDEKNMNKESIIQSRYFFSNKSRALFRNTLSKLWWVGRFTYDARKSNPFELTEVLGNRDISTRINDLFTSNFSRNPHVTRAFLATIKSYEDRGIPIGGYTYRKLVQYMNLYGGMTIIDYLEEEELMEVISSKIEKLFKDPFNTDAYVKNSFKTSNKLDTNKNDINLNKENKNTHENMNIKQKNIEKRTVQIGDYITIKNLKDNTTRQFKMNLCKKGKTPEVQSKCMNQSIGFTFLYKNEKYELIKIDDK